MRANEFISESTLKHKVADEDYDPNGPPPGPEFKPTMPKGTVRVDVSDVYDWYKLGQHISNMKGLGKHDFGKGPPSTIFSFGDEETEHKYIKDLEKSGLTTTDIDPIDPNQPKGMKRQKVDPTFNVNEQSVAEDQTQNDDNITVQNNVETSFRNGYRGKLIANTPERQVGYLNYSVYNDVPKIEMIYVAQDYRRRGAAMKMLKALQEISPNEEIDWGYTTDDGGNLRKSIDFRKVPNSEIIKKRAKLAGVRSKLARLNYRLEQLQQTNPELAKRYVQTVSDRWNQLNDIEYRLENELSFAKGEYSKLIPEEELDEGLKQTLANLGLAAAVGAAGGLGGFETNDKMYQYFNRPEVVSTQQSVPPQSQKPVQKATPQSQKPVQKATPQSKRPVEKKEIQPITKNPQELKLLAGAKKAGMSGVELAQFLAQCGHETAGWNRMVEKGSKYYFRKYEFKKILGNKYEGDGAKFKGRGYVQLTGRDNYTRAGRALGIDLINNPDLASHPDYVIPIALWYWNDRVRPDVENWHDSRDVTKQINGGLNGLKDRHRRFVSYMKQLEPSKSKS
jgi:predicted chitinase